MAGELLRIDLVASQQKEKRQPQLAQKFDRLIHVDHLSHVRPHERARQQKQHRLRHNLSRDHLRDDRAKRRHEHDHCQGNQIYCHFIFLLF